jgi:hypothetical protein
MIGMILLKPKASPLVKESTECFTFFKSEKGSKSEKKKGVKSFVVVRQKLLLEQRKT